MQGLQTVLHACFKAPPYTIANTSGTSSKTEKQPLQYQSYIIVRLPAHSRH